MHDVFLHGENGMSWSEMHVSVTDILCGVCVSTSRAFLWYIS